MGEKVLGEGGKKGEKGVRREGNRKKREEKQRERTKSIEIL